MICIGVLWVVVYLGLLLETGLPEVWVLGLVEVLAVCALMVVVWGCMGDVMGHLC